MHITQEMAQYLFEYDGEIPSALRWRNPRGTHAAVLRGQIVGTWHHTSGHSKTGQRYVDIGRVRIPVKRVVWAYMHGTHPRRWIWFRNGDTSDCRIENLSDDRQIPTEEEKRKMQRRWDATQRARYTDEEWYAHIRRRNLRINYGLTPDDWLALYRTQNGVCAICKKPETLVRRGKVEALAVDHCHTTDRVRALLCHQCNNGLGRFFDDPALLRAAAEYLEAHAAPSIQKIEPA